MSAPRVGRGSTKSRQLWTVGSGVQPNVDVHIEIKNDFHFCILIWKYVLSNINVMFEYTVLEKIRLDCKVCPSPPPTYTHPHLLHILSAYHRSLFDFCN